MPGGNLQKIAYDTVAVWRVKMLCQRDVWPWLI
jgi:hypothetical protein